MKTGLLRICLVIVFMAVWFSSRAQVQELYLKGIALADQEAYQEARMHFEEALRYDNDNPDCLLEIAKACQRSGDSDAAITYLRQLEEQVPGKGSYLLATLHASSGNAGEAVKYLEIHLRSPYKLPSDFILLDASFSVIEDSPQWKALWSQNWYSEDEELLQELRYLTSGGDYLQSLEIIDSELEERPGWDALHAARGDVLLKMGQFQGAVQSYSRAIENNPAHPSYHYGRAQAYIAQDKYEKAIPDIERAYRMEPGKLELLIEIGRVYHKAGQFRKAAEYLERYTGYYTDKPEAHLLYGLIQFDSGKYFDALEQFNTCLRLEKGDPRYFAARGKTYLETATYRYALNDFGMALDLNPHDKELWFLKGQARWYLNDRDGAIGDWERAAQLGSNEAVEKLLEHAGGK